MLGHYRHWASLFPENSLIRYFATEGHEGSIPEPLCKGFKDSGFFVFRNGWDADATQMVVKAGPKGEWHCQPDNGTFELWYKGERLFPDSGSYVYAGDAEVMAWRDWFRRTSSHNTLTLDDQNLTFTQSRTLLWDPSAATPVLVTENPSYDGLTHRRSVFFVRKSFFVIVDEAFGTARGEVSVHFHPGPDSEGHYTLVCNGPRKTVRETREGWMSTAYRYKLARPHLVYHTSKDSVRPVRFVSVLIPGEGEHRVKIGPLCSSDGKLRLTLRLDNEKYLLQYAL